MLDAAQLALVRETALGVIASVDAEGQVQAATVKLTADREGAILLATLGSSRKAQNLRRDPRAAIVVQQPGVSLQIEGRATDATADTSAREQYLAAFPAEAERARQDGFTLLRIAPSWARLTDYR